MRRNHKLIAFLAYAMYFLTGAACVVIGSSLSQLVQMYGVPMEKVTLLSSSFALGRVLTVYLSGRMVEKRGAVWVLTIGTVLLGIFLLGVPTVINYYAGLVFAFLGGIGMGTQDAVCPMLLSRVSKDHYAGAMSASQAFFGLGNFATPFLVGVMLSGKLPFYYSYYILLIVPAVILVCIPFVKDALPAGQEQLQEQTVKPLYAKRSKAAYGAVILGNIAYCAVANGILTYTASFAQSQGIDPATSAFLLTVYNVGCCVGAAVFVAILNKISERTVLLGNLVIGLGCIAVMLLVDQTVVYFLCLAVAGFFLGVLFSVYVTIATRIDYRHVSRAGSVMGFSGGGSDILTPIITGSMVAAYGVVSAYYYVLIMGVAAIAAAVLLMVNTSEKEVR